MKATELMIGDWVQGFLPDTNSQIVGIINEYRVAIMGGGAYMEISNEDIQPIPITPEILEKNGFKRTQENRWVWEEKYHSNVDIIHIDDCVMFDKEYPSEKNGGLQTGGMIGCMSERGRIYIEGEYVHDLQHALRLCGIDKEIEL